MKYVLMDVEGTTTSISFVHDTLFPYAKTRLASFVKEQMDNIDIREIITATKKTIQDEESRSIDTDEAIKILLNWIEMDRKHSALKKLQGMIWKIGYQSGELKGHIYEEVPHVLKKWKLSGVELGIYSSGSVVAQRDLFGHSLFGDLNPLFSHNFDTSSGHKREVDSYKNILAVLKIPAHEVLFLSDIPEELNAAEAAGMKTIQLVRLEDVPRSTHQQVRSFDEIEINA